MRGAPGALVLAVFLAASCGSSEGGTPHEAGAAGATGSGGASGTGGAGATGGSAGAGAAGGSAGSSTAGASGSAGAVDAGDASTDATDDADAACPPGYGDCDGLPGCETDLQTSAAHCGACNTSCSRPNATGACNAGSCSFTCDAGWGDCDSDATNGCETFLDGNTSQCGTCGNDCGTEGCAAGQCKPVDGLTVLADVPFPEGSGLFAVAVDAANLYFTIEAGSGGVGSVPLAGGTVTMLETGTLARYLAVDATHAYYTTSTALEQVPIGGGSSSSIGGTLKDAAGVTVQGNRVYFADKGSGSVDGAIWSLPTAGGTRTLISGAGRPLQIATDGASVFWTGTTTSGVITAAVMRAPVGGGTATPLATGMNGPWAIATDGTRVYWANYYGGTLQSCPISGGAATTLAKALLNPTFIATDGTSVYVAHAGGLVKVPVGGGSQATLAPSGAGFGTPQGVAVDATDVYWVTSSGRVLKATK